MENQLQDQNNFESLAKFYGFYENYDDENDSQFNVSQETCCNPIFKDKQHNVSSYTKVILEKNEPQSSTYQYQYIQYPEESSFEPYNEYNSNDQTQYFIQEYNPYMKKQIVTQNKQPKYQKLKEKQKKIKNIKIQFPKVQNNSSDSDDEDQSYNQLNGSNLQKKPIKKQKYKNTNKNQKVNLGKKFILNQQKERESLQFFKKYINHIKKNIDLSQDQVTNLELQYFKYLKLNYNNYNSNQFQTFLQDYKDIIDNKQQLQQETQQTIFFRKQQQFNTIQNQLKNQIQSINNNTDDNDIEEDKLLTISIFNKLNRLCLYRYLLYISKTSIFTIPAIRNGFKIKDRTSVNSFGLKLQSQMLQNTELI